MCETQGHRPLLVVLGDENAYQGNHGEGRGRGKS